MSRRNNNAAPKTAPVAKETTVAASAATSASDSSVTQGDVTKAPAVEAQAGNEPATDQAASAPVSGEVSNTSDGGVADAGGDPSVPVSTSGDATAADPSASQAVIAPADDNNPTLDDEVFFFEVLTPFKYRGFPVKTPWVQMPVADAKTYWEAGVLGRGSLVGDPSQDVE